MSPDRHRPAEERALTTLGQLEQRRGENDRAMWLAPVITMAAQAFLLQILSDQSIPRGARLAVLVAGAVATLAACWTVLRGHAREVLYSETIHALSRKLGLDDVRPGNQELTREGGAVRKLDHWLVRIATVTTGRSPTWAGLWRSSSSSSPTSSSSWPSSCGRSGRYSRSMRSWTKRTTVAPSPTAVAQRLIDPARTSPAA